MMNYSVCMASRLEPAASFHPAGFEILVTLLKGGLRLLRSVEWFKEKLRHPVQVSPQCSKPRVKLLIANVCQLLKYLQ